MREDFLRTAVMTAVADGVYSEPEDRLLHQLAAAFGLELPQLHLLGATLVNKGATSPLPAEAQAESGYTDLLAPLQKWLDGIQVCDAKVARFLCRMIPGQCPFEREVVLFGRKVMHIPPCASSTLSTTRWWPCAAVPSPSWQKPGKTSASTQKDSLVAPHFSAGRKSPLATLVAYP
ncbi:hypothetical protein ACVW0Q_002600 [Thermostichus sp. MS-CIW-21]